MTESDTIQCIAHIHTRTHVRDASVVELEQNAWNIENETANDWQRSKNLKQEKTDRTLCTESSVVVDSTN